MSKCFCITDLLRFMVKEGEKLMKGSVHEANLFIVRDALVLVTEKETISLMHRPFHQRPQESEKSIFLMIWRDMGR